MSFLSFAFALFSLIVVPAYWLLPLSFRAPFLLCASLAFYAAAYPPHAALIVGLMLVVYALGRHIRPAVDAAGDLAGDPAGDPEITPRSKVLFVGGVVLCVLVLGYFKYARLVVQTVADLGGPVVRLQDIRVPLGISFFTFEFIHYLVDLRMGRIRHPEGAGPDGRLLSFSLFTLFFPTLLSGPIKRYQIFVSEGERHPRFRRDYLAEGLGRMLIGVGKKVIVADSMTAISGRLLTPDQVTPIGLWVAMYAYAVKIYFDFSGYSDLAIGAARLFGYRVPENFDHPYLRRNLSEFWRHWHMSLSSWIRDYLFIPLGGSRVSPLRAVLNLTLVMALCGLWHGASWNFVVWGLWHGVGLGALRLWGGLLRRRGEARPLLPAPLSRVLATLFTFHYVCLGWVLFATPSLRLAMVAFSRMFGRG